MSFDLDCGPETAPWIKVVLIQNPIGPILTGEELGAGIGRWWGTAREEELAGEGGTKRQGGEVEDAAWGGSGCAG
jgi:hypothetical protein